MKAILLVSHGSKEPEARVEIEILANRLRKRSDTFIVEPAFLEIESPDIPTGIKACVQKGAQEIVILLNFLNSGRHAGRDIPQIIAQARHVYPNVRFRVTRPIAQDEHLVDIFLRLIDEA